MPNIIKNFQQFRESNQILESDGNPGKEIKFQWSFNFESGKFKFDDVSEKSIGEIQKDFQEKILPTLVSPNIIGQKVEIILTATTSKVPLGSDLINNLKNENYEGTNEGLALARLDTLEEIMKEMLYKYLRAKDQTKENFLKDLPSKVSIVKKPLINQGPEFKKGDDPNSDKFKAFQRLTAGVKVLGEEIPGDRKIRCNAELKSEGDRGTSETLFSSFDKELYLMIGLNKQAELTFDPMTTPDSFLYRFGDKIVLTPFVGSHGRYYIVSELNQATQDSLDQKKRIYSKITSGGKTYLALDYKRELNEIFNKNNQLVDAINTKLKNLGIDKTVKELAPNFFDSEGKIEVYATHPEKSDGIFRLTVDAFKNKVLPQPKIAPKNTFTLEVTRTYTSGMLKLCVFSPLVGTNFNLKSKCL